MSEGLLQPNTPVKFEARNPYPRFSRLKSGDCYKLTIEVSEKDWQILKTMPDNAILEVLLWHHDGDGRTVEEVTEKPERKKKEAKPKGAFGSYWQAMYKAGFHNNHDLQNVLCVKSPDEVKDAIKTEFDVESLTFLPPDRFERWLEHVLLDPIITLSRQAAVKAAEATV